MDFNQFIRIYDGLLFLKKHSFPVLDVLDEFQLQNFKFHHSAATKLNKNMKAEGWYQIIDYQMQMMQKYLRSCWRVMLVKNVDAVDDFLFFLQRNPQLVCSMERSLLFFLFEADKAKKSFHLTEEILRSKDVEGFLASNSNDKQIQKIFEEIMVFKIQHFNDFCTYYFNYNIFMDWLPKWQNIYPNVWNGVILQLEKMKNSVNLDSEEVQKLYSFYNVL